MNQQQKNTIIITLGALAAIGPFSIDMYLPGFPAIAEDLDTDIAHVGLSLTSYFIGISLGQIAYGPLIDRFGRKAPLLAGLVIYMVAAIGCALAPDVYWLVGLRFLLALGGCVGMVASRAVVRDLFPPGEIAKVFSTLILIMGIAPIIAPTIGSFITASLGWRYIFAFLILFSASMFLLVKKFLPESREPDPSVSLMPRNIAREYQQVFKEPAFVAYALAGSISFAGLFAYIAGSPFVLIEYFELSETLYGWVFGLNAVGFIAGSQINRYLLKKSDSAQISLRAAFFQSLAGLMLAMGTVTGFFGVGGTILLLFTFMFFIGFLAPNTTALALQPFTRYVGSASAMIGSLQMVAGALASALVSYYHNSTAMPMAFVMAVCAVLGFTILGMHHLRLKRKSLEAYQ